MLETLSVYFPCNEITIDNIGFRTELARPSSGLRPPSLCGEGLPFSFSWSCLRANATAGKPRETTGNSSLRAKRGNPPVSLSSPGARRRSDTQKGTMSACWFVILSAAKDLILRKQADCRAPARHIKAGVIPAAGARSDGLAAHPLVISRQGSFQWRGLAVTD